MKYILLWIIILLILSNVTFSQGITHITDTLNKAPYQLNYRDPVNVVNGMLEACKTKNLMLIFMVFDPFIERGEFYKYRNVYFNKNEEYIKDLYDIKDSYVNGTVKISNDGRTAVVPMFYKSSVRQHQEEIGLVNRFGNWYISGF